MEAMNGKTDQQILVVDDDDAVRNCISHVLERNGFNVLAAANGPDAIQQMIIHGPTIALVLLDMTMPGMDGEQTFEALHQLQPDLYFLILSGGCDEYALRRLCQSGFCEHLEKPCLQSVLMASIHRMLSCHPRLAPVGSLSEVRSCVDPV